jgi:O-antigen/teichoic acid export membrane protein
LLAVSINFFNQVLLARYLSTTDYGVWSYALSLVAICGALSTLALENAVDRYIPIYHERREYGRLFGTLAFVAVAMGFTGLCIASSFYFVPGVISALAVGDAVWPILFVLVLAIPFDALDSLLVAVFASLARPSAIFFRKHLLGPFLKLSVMLL